MKLRHNTRLPKKLMVSGVVMFVLAYVASLTILFSLYGCVSPTQQCSDQHLSVAHGFTVGLLVVSYAGIVAVLAGAVLYFLQRTSNNKQ